MQGTAGDPGDPKAKDPSMSLEPRPGGGLLLPAHRLPELRRAGRERARPGSARRLQGLLAFTEFDPKAARFGAFVPVTDEKKIEEIGRRISPVNHVSREDAPTLIIHGDADKLVPIQQAELILARLKEAGVACELVVKKGAAHGWPGLDKDMVLIADWLDQHLRKG